MKTNKIVILLIGLCVQSFIATAQIDTGFVRKNIDFKDYLNLVSTRNSAYLAEKFNIDIADESINIARLFPNPSLSLNGGENFEDQQKIDFSYSAEIGTTIEFAGTRKARIETSLAESQIVSAELLDYFRNLQADAALIYLEALRQSYLFSVKMDSYLAMNQLSQADSIRYNLGSIMEIDASQSKVETGILFNELLQAEADLKNALINLSLLTGSQISDTVLFPLGDLKQDFKIFNVDELKVIAINNRSDLMLAESYIDYSEKSLMLTKKERKTDFDVCFGVEKSALFSGLGPSAIGVTAGIAFPLSFSNIQKSDVRIAQIRISQAEELYNQTALQIQTEVSQAFETYISACKQVANFDNGLLEIAESVKNGKRYSYQRGETSLLEVLNAQRTYNEIKISYYEALCNRIQSLIELERSVGIWDISF